MAESPIYTIGAWSAGGAGVTDANGTTWGINANSGGAGVNYGATTGIFDGPGVTLNQANFPNADGGLRARSFRPVATQVLQGWGLGSSLAGAVASRRAFRGILAGGGQSTLTITDIDGYQLTMTVELGDIPHVTPMTSNMFFWQLTLSAVDPYQYGAPVLQSTGLASSSGGLDYVTGGGLDYVTGGGLNYGTVTSTGLMTLANSGFETSWPVFTINAPTDGSTLINPSITNLSTGQQLVYTDTLSTGDQVVLTSAPINRSVVKNGTPYRVNLTVAQWFSVAPQSTVTVQFQGTATSATPQLAASLAPAY